MAYLTKNSFHPQTFHCHNHPTVSMNLTEKIIKKCSKSCITKLYKIFMMSMGHVLNEISVIQLESIIKIPRNTRVQTNMHHLYSLRH